MTITCVGCQHYKIAQAMLKSNEMPIIELEFEPDNPFDNKAIRFHTEGNTIGHVSKNEIEAVTEFLNSEYSNYCFVLQEYRLNSREELTWFVVKVLPLPFEKL